MVPFFYCPFISTISLICSYILKLHGLTLYAVPLCHGGRHTTSRRPLHYVTAAVTLRHGGRYTLSFMAVITLQSCCEIVFLPHLSFLAACRCAFMSQRLLHYFTMAVNPFYGTFLLLSIYFNHLFNL